MKRQKRKTKTAKKAAQPVAAAATSSKKTMSRRDLLRVGRNWGIAAVAVGATGWYTVRSVQAAMHEADLSRIGNGLPSVVQIHDPSCMQCVALQREARSAACEIGEDRIQFLVANISTADGRRLANAHGVGHVTLLIFDADGRRIDILRGRNTRSVLEARFRAHLAGA